jgi:hypothetical protein
LQLAEARKVYVEEIELLGRWPSSLCGGLNDISIGPTQRLISPL